MPLKPDTIGMTLLLGILTAFGPMSTDMYLPSLPTLQTVYDTDIARVQLTLSVFMIGFSAGMIIYGPLADRYGRKPVLLAALAVFATTTLLCAFAPTIDALIGLRFVQAVSASAPTVLARAVVRDLYTGTRASRELARMGSIMGVVPTVAPVLGGVFEKTIGWQANFVVVSVVGFVAFLVVWRTLPETVPERSTAPLTLPVLFGDFAQLLANRAFRAYVAIACATFGGLFAFISGSSFVLQNIYGLGPIEFAVCFAVVVIGYIVGTLIVPRLVTAYGSEFALLSGCLLMAVSGVAMVIAVTVSQSGVVGIVLPMIVYLIGLGFCMPQAMAAALMPFPLRAGAASSLLGAIQTCFGAIAGMVVGLLLVDSAWPMVIVIAGLGVMTFVLSWISRAHRLDAELL